jgi:hypothetical protein
MYLWLAGLGLFLILLPIPNPHFGPFRKAADAELFLRTLWQVNATALALSLTIIVFAVQAYRSSTQERYGGTLRRFIRATFLQEGYELGVIALLLVAAVLLGVGHGGPAGSAGVVSAAVSLLSIAVLPLLLTRALGTTNRDFLREERANRLALAVREQVDYEVQARLALLVVDRLATDGTIAVDRFGARGGSVANAILAGRVGVVADINIARLRRLARRCAGGGRITLTTRLAEYVGSESRVLLLPPGLGRPDRRLAQRVVTVRRARRREETLSRYLDDLHEEAVDAIRTGGPATFEAVADAYVGTLMEFPRSWQRYGQQYNEAMASGIELFPVGPVDDLRRQFYTNVVQAVRAGDEEVLLTAAYLPVRVASQALAYGADGLVEKMLTLSPSFLAAAWSQGGSSGALLEGRSYRHLVELTRFYLQPRLDEGGIAERLRVGKYVGLVYAQIQTMLKMAVDGGRVEFLRKLDGDWGTLLQHWHVGLLNPSPAEIPHLEEAVANGVVGARELLEHARDNATLNDVLSDLVEYRVVARFGLALWAWRKQPPSWRESFAHYSSYMGNLSEIADLTTKAFDAETRDRMPWSDWILSELQEGEAHYIGTPEAVIETFLALGLRAVDPAQPMRQLEPADWMPQYLEQARDLLDRTLEDPRNSDLPDVALRAEKLKQALESGAKSYNERERLSTIEAPLEQDKLDQFCEQARAGLESDRIVPDLLRLGHALTPRATRPTQPPLIESRTHKALFIKGDRVLGGDMIARDVGRQVAHLELRQLIEPMARVKSIPIFREDDTPYADQDFVEQLRSLISRMVEMNKTNYVVLLLPIQWRLSQALGLPFLGASAAAPVEWSLSEGTASDFLGFFATVPVFQFPEVPDSVIYVVDLARYVVGESWEVSASERVTVSVLSEDDARKRAQRTEGHVEVGEEEIAMRWREQAFITVDPGLRLSDNRDESAVIAVELPAELG